MLITYGVVWAMTLLMLLFSKQILSFYSLSEETTTMTMEVFIVHGICAVIVWPLAFALPNALRAANDVRFTMIVSLLSMWIFRIGFSYILAIYFNMGILAHGLRCVSIGSAAAPALSSALRAENGRISALLITKKEVKPYGI